MDANDHLYEENYVDRIDNRTRGRLPRWGMIGPEPMIYTHNPLSPEFEQVLSVDTLQEIVEVLTKYPPQNFRETFLNLISEPKYLHITACINDDLLDLLDVSKRHAYLLILERNPLSLVSIPNEDRTIQMILTALTHDIKSLMFINAEFEAELQQIVKSIDFSQYINGPKNANN